LLIALLGALLGFIANKIFSPDWGTLLYAMRAAVWGYGIGVPMGAFKAHRKYDGTRSFSRAFYSSMSALLAVVFLSEPLQLGNSSPLMWAGVIFFPPFVATLFLYERKND